MPKSELCYYPWYVDRWMSSTARVQMSLEERGLYRELLDHYYKHGSLPSDAISLMRVSGSTKREFNRAWTVVGKWFEERDGRLMHKAAQNIRVVVLDMLDKNSERSRKAAKTRWHKQSPSTANGIPQAYVRAEREQCSPDAASEPGALHEALPTATAKQHTSNPPARVKKLKNLNKRARALPSSAFKKPLPSVGSLRDCGAENKKQNSAGKSAARRSRADAPAPRSEGETNGTAQQRQEAAIVARPRIVALHGDRCDIELATQNGREIRSMALAEAERLLAQGDAQ
jgi:uncharacterized protein YdaU (DUF1376 family)